MMMFRPFMILRESLKYTERRGRGETKLLTNDAIKIALEE